MAVWLEVERRLAEVPSANPSKQRFLDRVNFFGQTVAMDKQGRVRAAPAAARERGHDGRGERARPAEPPRGVEPEAAARSGCSRRSPSPTRTAACSPGSGSDVASGASLGTSRSSSRRSMELLAVRPGGLLRRRHGGPRRPRGRDPAPQRARRPPRRLRPRRGGARAVARRASASSAIACASSTRTSARSPIAWPASGAAGRPPRPGRELAAARRGRARVQLQRRGSARHAHGPDGGVHGRRPREPPARARAGRRHLPLRRGARVAPHRARDRGDARRRRIARRRPSWRQVVRRSAGRSTPARPRSRDATFQALRIHVNRELEGLGPAPGAHRGRARARRPPGRDRLPQPRGPRGEADLPRARARAGSAPDQEAAAAGGRGEARNPRARSARLRAIERAAA